MNKYAWPMYDYMLKNEPALATHIIKHTNIHRPAAYKALQELYDLKLVKWVPNGKRKLWQVTSSARIHELLNEISNTADTLAPKTNEQHPEFANAPIRTFRGKTGIRAIFDDVIIHTPKNSTFYRYTSERDLHLVNSYLSKDYRERRDKKRLERLVISNPVSGEQKRPRLERFIKYIPEESSLFNQNIIQLIYGDRLAFIDLNTEEGLIIENKTLAEFQKIIFQQLYKKLT